MAVLKCKMCGGQLDIIDDETVVTCEYCGSKQTIPTVDDDKKLKLYERANKLRFNCDFDKAASVYENIISDFSDEAEAYWGLVLCTYGIEYVDDPATGKKIPTCHRSSFDSVMDDPNFEMVMENADSVARSVYREQAKQIEEIRKGIIEVSGKEEPYDIFICYKETAENGERTLDSVLAQDVYDVLTEKGYRVFFSRITLEDKLGMEYEPYIFAALNSAKVMLAFGTDYDYYNAVWVKNEWSRYLKLMAKDKSKHLIPCFKNLDAYDMPKEFAKLQAQDLGKVGAVQDLVRGIEKLHPLKKTVETTIVVQQSAGNPTSDSLLKRVFMFLEDKDWKSVNEYCEKVLDIDPENAQAYLGKLMAELEVSKQDNLKDCKLPFNDRNNYKKALRFGNEELKNLLTESNKHVVDRNENHCKSEIYEKAKKIMNNAITEDSYLEARSLFISISGYMDSDQLAEKCKFNTQRLNDELLSVEQLMKELKLTPYRIKEFNTKKKQLIKLLNSNKENKEKLEYLMTNHDSLMRKLNVFEADKKQLYDSILELENAKKQLGLFSSKQKKNLNHQINILEEKKREIETNILMIKQKFNGYSSVNDIEKDLQSIIFSICNLEKQIADINKPNFRTEEDIIEELNKSYNGKIRLQKYRQIQNIKYECNLGGMVCLGKYRNEDIKWQIIALEKEKALLISDKVLDFRNHSSQWGNSGVRKWLNNDFFKEVFCPDEIELILNTNVEADRNPNYNTNPGVTTKDKIFLLSIKEAKRYYHDDISRCCKLTTYALDNKLFMNEVYRGCYSNNKDSNNNCYWWLRSPGGREDSTAYVNADGSISLVGNVSYSKYGIRPAMWIDLTK